MNANHAELRNVTGDELQTVEGGFRLLGSLVIIMTAGQQQKALNPPPQPTLVHEPIHQ